MSKLSTKQPKKQPRKKYLFSLNKEQTELWKELCEALNIRRSYRIDELIQRDIGNLISLSKILKKGVKHE